jgi:drug/metabolite transporter (DMT)-like permease
VSRVATYAFVNPVVAVILGWLVLGEPLTARTAVASAVIVVAVMLIVTSRARGAPVPQREPLAAAAELPGA